MKLYQTAPWTADVELSSVAAALWQTWNDKSWQTVAEIAKPPLLNFESSAELNAPERKVRAMEAAVSTGATTDEWRMTHKVQHQELALQEISTPLAASSY